MKSLLKRLAIYKLLILAVVLGLTSPAYAADESILHFISSETPPFWSKTLFLDGMCGEILHELSRQIGVRTVIEYQPTARIKEMVGFNLLGNPELFLSNHDFQAIIPVAVFRLALFYYKPHHKEKIAHGRLEDFKGYTIGILKGSLSSADLAYFKKSGIKFEESYSIASLFKKLKLGRIDLCIVIELSGLLTINRLFPDEEHEFKRFEVQRSITPITLMIESNYPNGEVLVEKIKKSLETMISNGKYHEILEKYYGKGNIPGDWFRLLDRYSQMYDLS